MIIAIIVNIILKIISITITDYLHRPELRAVEVRAAAETTPLLPRAVTPLTEATSAIATITAASRVIILNITIPPPPPFLPIRTLPIGLLII